MRKFCNSFTEKIQSIDIYGQKPQFNIDKTDSFKTTFGSLLTISSILTTVLALSYFSLQLFDVTNPKLVYSVKNIFSPPLISLNNTNYGFAFGLQNPFTYDQFIDESVYRAEAYHMTGKRVESGNTSFFDWSLEKLEIESCNIEKFPISYNKLFKDLPMASMYCLKNTSFSLSGTFLNEEYQYIILKLFECKNKTNSELNSSNLKSVFNPSTNSSLTSSDVNNKTNNNSNYSNDFFLNGKNNNTNKNENEIICKPKTYIDEVLAGTFFSFSHTDLTIDPTNYTNPNQLYSGDSYTTVSNKFFKEMHHYLNIIKFETDKGWLVEELEKETFLKLDFIKEMTDFRKSENFLSYTLKLSTKVETYSRSFAKVQNIAAEAGGFLKIISIICLVVSHYYNKAKFYQLVGQALMTEKSNTDKKHHYKDSCSKNILDWDMNPVMGRKKDQISPFIILKKSENAITNGVNNKDDYEESRNYFKNEFVKNNRKESDSKNNNDNKDNENNYSEVQNKSNQKLNNYLNENTNTNIDNNNDNINFESLNKIYNQTNNRCIETNVHSPPNKSVKNSPGKHSTTKRNILYKPSLKEKDSLRNNIQNKNSNENSDLKISNEDIKKKTINKKGKAKRFKIKISFCESFWYLLCLNVRRKNVNFKKLNVIRHKVDELMDILNLFRSINDLDRLKRLVLDNDQLKLFNLPYFQEVNFDDSEKMKYSKTVSSLQDRGQNKLEQKDFEYEKLLNLVAVKEDSISKKLVCLVNN